MNFKRLLSLPLLAMICLSATAQTSPPSEDIQQIVESTMPTNKAADAILSPLFARLRPKYPNIDNAKWALITADLRDFMLTELKAPNGYVDSMKDSYQSRLTASEAHEIATFLRSDAGAKFVQQRDEVTVELMPVMNKEIIRLSPQIDQRFNTLVKKYGTNGPNSVIEERLRNAQVTETKLSNGAVFTEFKFAGSLQPNFDLGCISISEVTSKFNPPALIYAAKKCIQQDQYPKAWALLATANGFAYYDLKRLADRSTQGAQTVLTMNAFADLTNPQREKTQQTSKEIQSDPEQVKTYCNELTKIGPPMYEPQWAIRHGIGAYQEPRNGDYLTNVDAHAIWEEVLKNRCSPQK